jgi:transposase-like protein
MKSDQSEDNTMKKSPPRSYQRWTRSERDKVVQMRRNGVPIAEIAARFDRTPASVTTMLQVLSRDSTPIPRSRARKFGRRALELGTFLLLLGFCFAALVLL